MVNLHRQNTPKNLWLCEPDPPDEAWSEAYRKAIPTLGICQNVEDIDTVTELTLGEGQFGSGHWNLSPIKRTYYTVKPILPAYLRCALRRLYKKTFQSSFPLHWPIEERYVLFQFEVLRSLLVVMGQCSMSYRHFWPNNYRYAFVLTHDIETREGQAYVRRVADFEQELGFRSCFNFVPERYELDIDLLQELRERGFEIGVHGLNHDGKLFNSKQIFMDRAKFINQYLKELDAIGFRSPLMMRNPHWMQALDMKYDLSFFDTDPFEPIPGGVMSIWPFTIGHFIELPCTLPQDCTLAIDLGEINSQFWFAKLEFIRQHSGMALINTHPDYLKETKLWDCYAKFLQTMADSADFWHPLPREVARWWRKRAEPSIGQELPEIALGNLNLEHNQITLSLPSCSLSELSTFASIVS